MGVWLNEGCHYDYPGRSLEEEVPIMSEIEREERQTYFQNRGREAGFNGVSLLHRLNPLYQFNILTDIVFDAMHLLPLNVVKNHLIKLFASEAINDREFSHKLKQIPWSTDYRSSRLPINFESMGYWKAEEFQKLAYPASEFVLNGLLDGEEYKAWAPVPRMVEFVFNAGRDGWTDDVIQKFQRLSWRYCIFMEEHFGTQAFVINLYNLIHFHEDITRFSAPDNYWCTHFERAVSRYVRQSSNRKHFREKTFARKECQREFLKFCSSGDLSTERH